MLRNDIRYALRQMRRSPGFTAVAVISLALGIGANTAIFSLFYTVLLRALPVARPERLVEFLQKYPGEPRGNGYWTWTSYEHFRDRNQSFESLFGTGFDNLAPVRMPGAEAENVVLENVTGNYFEVLGLVPALGRFIAPADVLADGSGNVAVLSWAYWNSRFQRDPSVLGKRIFVHDKPLTIIGVAPRLYTGPRVGVRTDLWMPQEKEQLAILGRLKSGVTLDSARAEMKVLYQFTIDERAANSKDSLVRQLKVELEPAAAGLATVRDQYGSALSILMAVVALLLLLACANLASMLLARAAGRQRELATRVGLGASPTQLLRQMLTESLMLSAAGTLLGVVLAYLGAGALTRILSSGRAHERIEIQVQPDLTLLAFTAAVAMLTGLLFGLAPAYYAFRSSQSGLRQSAKQWRLLGKGLVASQVALSVLLVTGASLFLNHLERLRNFDLGFRRDHVLLVSLDPARGGYRREQLALLYPEALARLEAIPGVRSASISACTPIQGCGASRFVTVDGFREAPEERRYTALSVVAPRYFETLGIPLIAGRDFNRKDAGGPRVAILGEAMARHYFPDGNPIGKYLSIDKDPRGGNHFSEGLPFQIVGVAGNAKNIELREAPPRAMYLSMFQDGRVAHQFSLRTSGDPRSLIPEARSVLRDVLKTAVIGRVTTLSDQVDAAVVPERLIAALSGCFGVLGAALAGIGLYGLLAFNVSRRTREIGVRMALGATAGDIRWLVLGEALVVVSAGLLAGLALVEFGKPLAARVLQDLKPDGAAPLLMGAGAVLAVALLTSYLPVRRALRVDPTVSLRHE